MRVQINDKIILIPSALSEMTLGQRIAFQQQHGDLLNEMHKSILEMDPQEQELELIEWQLEKMYRTVSFFSGFSVESLRQSEFINQIFAIHTASMEQIFQDEQRLINQPETEFSWNGELWEIPKPELKHGDKMTFGEVIDSKQMVQNMLGLSKNRWECLIPLCCIFLRRVGEKYQENWLVEGSERMRLMESLPLNIALQVNFFLSSSLCTFASTFQSLLPQELSQVADS